MTVDVGAGLDALVAEKVFGVKERAPQFWRGNSFYASPSTTWEGAGLVVKAMRDKGFEVILDTEDDDPSSGWCCNYFSGARDVSRDGETFPEAVCRAALAAIEAGDEDD